MTFQKHKSHKSKPIWTTQDHPWRIAYPWFDQMRTKQASGSPMQTPRFDATVCAPKLHTDPYQCKNFMTLHNLATEAAAKAWPQNPWPIAGGVCKIEDGDKPFIFKTQPGQQPRIYNPAEYAHRAGHWTFEISSGSFRPSVAVAFDGTAMDVPCQTMNGKTFYKSGDYATIRINAFTYQNETFGVKFGFDMIVFTREGEPIGSSGPKSAASMYAALAGPAAQPQPVAAVTQPYPPQQPAHAPLYAPLSPPLAPAALGYPAAAPAYAPPGPVAPPVPPPYPVPARAGLPPFPR